MEVRVPKGRIVGGGVAVRGPKGRTVGGGVAGREGGVVTEETERTGGGEDLVGTGAAGEDHRVVVWRKEIWRLKAVQASTPRRQWRNVALVRTLADKMIDMPEIVSVIPTRTTGREDCPSAVITTVDILDSETRPSCC